MRNTRNKTVTKIWLADCDSAVFIEYYWCKALVSCMWEFEKFPNLHVNLSPISNLYIFVFCYLILISLHFQFFKHVRIFKQEKYVKNFEKAEIKKKLVPAHRNKKKNLKMQIDFHIGVGLCKFGKLFVNYPCAWHNHWAMH